MQRQPKYDGGNVELCAHENHEDVQEDAKFGAHEYAEPPLGLRYRHGLCDDSINLFRSLAGAEGSEVQGPRAVDL